MSDITEWTVAQIIASLDGDYDDGHDVHISASTTDGTDVAITLFRDREQHLFHITILEVDT